MYLYQPVLWYFYGYFIDIVELDSPNSHLLALQKGWPNILQFFLFCVICFWNNMRVNYSFHTWAMPYPIQASGKYKSVRGEKKEGPKENTIEGKMKRFKKRVKMVEKCRSEGFRLSSVLYIEIWWLLTIVSPLLPLSRCLYPWGGSRGAHGAPLLGTTVGDWPPRLTHLRRSPEQSTVCRTERAGRPQGLLISNSSHGAGLLKRSNNNDCVMIWKWQQNLSRATGSAVMGDLSKLIRVSVRVSILFIFCIFLLTRVHAAVQTQWAPRSCDVRFGRWNHPELGWAPYRVQDTNYAKRHPSAAQIELQLEPALCHCSGRSPPHPG